MVRQTPFSFCTPNDHTGVIFVTQLYHFNSYFEEHHFLRWGSFKYFSLSLSASFHECTQREELHSTAYSLTHSQQQNRRDEEMKSSGEAVKGNRSIMRSRASVDSVTQSPVHRADSFTSRLRLYLVTTGQEA